MRLLHQLLITGSLIWTFLLFVDFKSVYLLYIGLAFLYNAQVSAFYHRCLSHKMWSCPTWLQHILLFINAGFLAGHAAVWMAIHVKHHKHSDTNNDAHGPKVGVFTTLMNSFYQFSPKHVGVFLAKSKPVALQFKYYYAAAPIIIACLSFIDIAIWPIITSFLWIGVITTNYICHWNSRPHNFGFLSLITGGDSYHKKHHESNDLRFGTFDTGYFISKLLAKLGSPIT